jgi:hypothetical protein
MSRALQAVRLAIKRQHKVSRPKMWVARPLMPIDVRDELANWGFDMSRYANDLSAVHTVLKRLNKAGEIRFVPRPGGSRAYEWQRPIAPVNTIAAKPHSPTKAKK